MLTESQVRSLVASVKEGVDAHSLPLDADFSDSGFDSLDVASILLALQETHGIEVPAGQEADIKSMQDIIDFSERVNG